MKKAYLFILAMSLLGMSGCGDRKKAETDRAVQSMRQSFDTASEDLKTKYQELKSALDSNDFLKADGSLDQLQRLQSQMSPEQQSAVAEQKQILMLRASAAAQNGDVNAAKVIEAVRSRSRSR